MDVLWQQGPGLTVRQVLDGLTARDLACTRRHVTLTTGSAAPPAEVVTVGAIPLI